MLDSKRLGNRYGGGKARRTPKIPVTLIIWLAIAKQFQGLPKGPREERYSVQIIDDLVAEALESRDAHPIVRLCVHAENQKAIALYQWYGFTEELDDFTDRDTGIRYLRMAMILNDAALLQIRDAMTRKK